MKKFLYSLASSFFREEIKAHVELHKDNHWREISIEKDRIKSQINFPLETKVIYRSNEPGPLLIGHIVDHIPICKSQQLICAIKCEKTGKVSTPMSSPIWWDEEREKSLNKLDWWEQWNVINRFAHTHTRESALKREIANLPKCTSCEKIVHFYDPDLDKEPSSALHHTTNPEEKLCSDCGWDKYDWGCSACGTLYNKDETTKSDLCQSCSKKDCADIKATVH